MTGTEGLTDPATALDYLDRLRACSVLPPPRVGRVGVVIVLADARGSPLGALSLADVAAAAPQSARVHLLAPLLRSAAEGEVARGALLVVVRAGADEPLGGDHGWRDAFTGTTTVAGLTDLGSYLATPTLLYPLSADRWVA